MKKYLLFKSIISIYTLAFFITAIENVNAQGFHKQIVNYRSGVLNKSIVAKTEGGTLCPVSMLLQAQDTATYLAGGTAVISTAQTCLSSPFVIQPKAPSGITDTINDLYAPCFEFMFHNYQSNLRTNASVTIYEGGQVQACFCPSSSFPIGG